MATIVFMPFYWASDLNPTFALAGKLRNRGHSVHYLCIPDTAERIRSQGFDFTPVFSRAFPKAREQASYFALCLVAEGATCLWRRARRLKRRLPTISLNLVATYCSQFIARVRQTFKIELPVRAFVQVARPCGAAPRQLPQFQSSDETPACHHADPARLTSRALE
jgi:hypothetical protein